MEEKSTLRSSVPVQVFSLHFMLVFAYVSAHQEVNIPPEKETNKGNSICCFSHFVTQHTYESLTRSLLHCLGVCIFVRRGKGKWRGGISKDNRCFYEKKLKVTWNVQLRQPLLR